MPDAWAEKQLQQIADDAQKCAKHYEDKSGTFDVRAAIDLYRAIARLADTVRIMKK